MIALGQTGDPENDPTLLWPKERKELKAGTLSFTLATPQKGAVRELVNFDPMLMADGVCCNLSIPGLVVSSVVET